MSLPSQAPAFMLGITGSMALDDARPEQQKVIQEAIKSVFRKLASPPEQQATAEITGIDQVPSLGVPPEHQLLLSCMAPGSDTLAAIAAEEEQIGVIGCLPFPEEIYKEASTFIWSKSRIEHQQNLEEANARRQETLQDWLEHKLVDKYFIPLHADHALDKATLIERLQAHRSSFPVEPTQKEELRRERYLRYRAAGEHVAIHSHVLIAVVPHGEADRIKTTFTVREDESKDSIETNITTSVFTEADSARHISSGTSAVIDVKRGGFTPGLLSNDPGFVWASNGPTILIEYPNNWLAPDSNEAMTSVSDLKISVIYPADAISSQHSHPDKTFCRIVHSLSEFQKLCGELKEHENFDKMVDYVAHNPLANSAADVSAVERTDEIRSLFDKDIVVHNWFLKRLTNLWDIRKVAAASSRKESAKYNVTLFRMFFWTILAAISLHFASHWHVGNHETHKTGQHENVIVSHAGEAAESDPHVKDKTNTLQNKSNSSPEPPEEIQPVQSPHTSLKWSQIVFQLLAGFFFYLALREFQTYRSSRRERIRFDHRALAEGLRVQTYWILAGLADSVPASYMQRQRGEMDWFRRAISAIAAPYHRWSSWFDSLSFRQKQLALKHVSHAWLKQQYQYMANEFSRNARLLHFSHVAGQSLAITGLFFAALILINLLTGLGTVPLLTVSVSVSLLISIMMIWILAWIWGIRKVQSNSQAPEVHFSTKHDQHATSSLSHAPEIPLPYLNPNDRRKLKQQMLESYRWTWIVLESVGPARCKYLWLSLILFAFGFLLSQVLPHLGAVIPGGVPEPAVWWGLFTGIYLLLGAMTIAYAEKNLLSEHAMQYNAMASMCRAAQRRIQGHLQQIDLLLNEIEFRQANTGNASEVFENESDEYLKAQIAARIAAIQHLLRKAGHQFLDENAEWLILHRSRPMEPVMAG